MSGSMLPASVYGLRVPAGGLPIPSNPGAPATFRITMAAIDPTAVPQLDETNKVPRATLKLIRLASSGLGDSDSEDEDDEEYDEDDIKAIQARLRGIISDEDEEMSDDDEDSSEDEKNGGPSDPAKSKKARKAAMTKKLQEELDEMELDGLTNGAGKGKGKAADDDDEEIDSDDLEGDDDEDEESEELVLCTLDPEKNYQQPLDITIGEHEDVYFMSSGTHDIFITGNYVLPPDFDEEDDEDYGYDGMDYDLSPDEDELDGESDSEEDELDDLENPRITEVESEDDAPALVPAAAKKEKKGKNKRPAESEDLDDLINKATKATPATNGEKSQTKKLKTNDGQAVAAAQEKKDQKDTPSSDKKKVQFSKNLEMGPTGSPKVEDAKKDTKKEEAKGPRTVQGVIVEDKKLGKGKAAKKGDRVEMRYIGKLKSNGKQFDANKKGKPFSFKLGTGEVIKGWDIGVAGITAGGERRLTIPANLAYGKRGAPPDIPGNADLVFDIKCIGVH